MMIKLDFSNINHDILLFCAFRYALGRRSYVPSVVEQIIIDNWENMPLDTRKKYKQEIREAIEKSCAGDKYDILGWKRILELED
jgi:hypothetical protein